MLVRWNSSKGRDFTWDVGLTVWARTFLIWRDALYQTNTIGILLKIVYKVWYKYCGRRTFWLLLLVLWQPKTGVDSSGDALWGWIDILKVVCLQIRFAACQCIDHEAVRQDPWRVRGQDIHEDTVQDHKKIHNVCRQNFRRWVTVL